MINSNLPYYKIKDLAYDLDMTIIELRKTMVSFGVLEQKSNGSKKHFLLIDIALKYGLGEILHKPYGCYHQQAPYNIYFITEIEKVLDRNIPRSDWYGNNVSDAKLVIEDPIKKEPIVNATNSSDNNNIDTDLNSTDITSYNYTHELTSDQKEAWL